MARVSTYLDSASNTEPAFAFFRPAQDMFRGACFGSLRDRRRVQWMVHCRNGSAA